ncbi:hypothetical protein IWZ03DRAFT_378289 [Phyllosticta citriasiana]|uniref:Secreted protein n=1 Tax=Phyllosticta citriasiana TaxID=595635 RepID=A0ABR1KK98_9PEZI
MSLWVEFALVGTMQPRACASVGSFGPVLYRLPFSLCDSEALKERDKCSKTSDRSLSFKSTGTCQHPPACLSAAFSPAHPLCHPKKLTECFARKLIPAASAPLSVFSSINFTSCAPRRPRGKSSLSLVRPSGIEMQNGVVPCRSKYAHGRRGRRPIGVLSLASLPDWTTADYFGSVRLAFAAIRGMWVRALVGG